MLFVLYVVKLESHYIRLFVYFTGAEFPIILHIQESIEAQDTQYPPVMQSQQTGTAYSDELSIGYVTMTTVSDFMRSQKAKIADSDKSPTEYETILDFNYEVRFSVFSIDDA